jgi:transcriptional regulator with XRE-family HTH domain
MSDEWSQDTTRRFDRFRKRLGIAIRELRDERGLTQRRLARRLRPKLSSGYISQVENAKSTPGLNALQSIAVALHLDLEDLLAHAIRSGAASSETLAFMRKYEALSEEDRVIALQMMGAFVRGAWKKRRSRERKSRKDQK